MKDPVDKIGRIPRQSGFSHDHPEGDDNKGDRKDELSLGICFGRIVAKRDQQPVNLANTYREYLLAPAKHVFRAIIMLAHGRRARQKYRVQKIRGVDRV